MVPESKDNGEDSLHLFSFNGSHKIYEKDHTLVPSRQMQK